MIWIFRILAAVTGLAGGCVIAGGVFALVTSTGMMSRLAARTDTKKYVLSYETAVILGGAIMNVIYVFFIANKIVLNVNIGELLLKGIYAFGMLFAGMFVGCLAVSLSEAVKATAIFARRIKLNKGIDFVVFSLAIGKCIAVILQFLAK